MGTGMARREVRLSMRVWDLPTRLFHWLIVLLIAASYATAQLGLMEWHFLSGYAVLALLLFRLVWGFIGSDTARFSRFLKSPVAAVRQLTHFTRREPDTEIGHNAAGGWMVLLMLLLIAAEVGTGLFSNDDVMNDGPLRHYVSKEISDQITSVHSLIWTLLLIAIGLHVLAVIGYAVVKGHDLVRPMVTGRKRLPGTMRPPRMASPLLALAVMIVACLVVWALVTFA
jgi:cytochrome b